MMLKPLPSFSFNPLFLLVCAAGGAACTPGETDSASQQPTDGCLEGAFDAESCDTAHDGGSGPGGEAAGSGGDGAHDVSGDEGRDEPETPDNPGEGPGVTDPPCDDCEPPTSFEFGESSVFVPDKDQTYAVTTLGEVTTRSQLSVYGGDARRTLEATGYFRAHEGSDGWTLVDPDGHPFISVGLNSVELGGGVDVHGSLADMGFNTLANWSDYDDINTDEEKIPHTVRGSFVANFVKDDAYDGGTEYLEDLREAGVLPVVFSDFDEFCDDFAARFSETRDDPWVIGIFSDNELPFYDGSGTYGDVIARWLALPATDPYYQYAQNWLQDRGSSIGGYDDADKADFATHIVRVYHQKVGAAIRRYDDNHLYIGTRLHGAAKRQANIMDAAGEFVDVLSINFYGEWAPTTEAMDMWLRESGRPFMITEFYTKGMDSGLGNADGAGWEVQTQEDRALFYTNFSLQFYAHPGAVGTHWFRYIDKAGQDSNKGIISESHEWYQPLREAATNVNRDIYQLVDSLRAQ